MNQCFISFYCRVMPHCTYMPYFVHPFINWQIFGLFVVWTVWILLPWAFMYEFLCGHLLLFLLGVYLGLWLLGHVVVLSVTFWGIARMFYKASAPLYIPTWSIRGYQFFHILTLLLLPVFFGSSHPSGCLVPHCGFDLYFYIG